MFREDEDYLLMKLLDNLRRFAITGDAIYYASSVKMRDELLNFNNCISRRAKKILEMNGFIVIDDRSIKVKNQAPVI